MENKKGTVKVDIEVKCRCGKVLDVNAQDAYPLRTETGRNASIVMYVESHNCTCDSSGNAVSRVNTAIFDLLPVHLHLTRNPKAEPNDRWRIYNAASHKYLEYSGSSTIQGCIQKYLEYEKNIGNTEIE